MARRYYLARLQGQSILRLSYASAALASARDGASTFQPSVSTPNTPCSTVVYRPNIASLHLVLLADLTTS